MGTSNQDLTRIHDLVQERGYKAGLTDDQFRARNVIKLLEEALELLYETPIPQSKYTDAIFVRASALKIMAKDLFDRKDYWASADIPPISDDAKKEAADVLVTLSCISSAGAFDVVQQALEKAEADVKRGVK